MVNDIVLAYLPAQFGGGQGIGLPPLGVYSLAASLRLEGMAVRVVDASFRGCTLEETVDAILDERPGLVGLSVLTPQLKSAAAVVRLLRRRGFSGRIVCGGPHFNNTMGETFELVDVDAIFYGECETVFAGYAADALSGRDTAGHPNVIHRQSGHIVVNPPSAAIQNLDTLPFPDLSQGEGPVYRMLYSRHNRTTSIMCSRGCPYLCSFCDVFSVWGRKVRFRSAANVVDELEFNVERFGIREFVFKDSTFTLNYKWLDRFLDEMETRRLGVNWSCNTRVDRVTREHLERMKGVGLTGVFFGVESGNQGILDRMRKNIRVDQIEPAFRMVDDLGIQAKAFFMVGNPGETPETAEQTLSLALRLPAAMAYVSVATAFPGTETYDIGVSEGLLEDPHWYAREAAREEDFAKGVFETSRGYLTHPGFSIEDQVAFCKKFWRRFYFRPVAVYRVFFRFGSFHRWLRALTYLPKFLRFVFSRKRNPG